LPKARPAWAWVAILLVALSAYGVRVSREALWYDEAYSAAMADCSVAEIVSRTRDDVHPPLCYLLLRGVRVTFGNSEFDLRLLSVVGAVASVGLGAGPVRRLFGRSTSYIYAVVALSTPALVIYAHEARMYALLIWAVTAGALHGCLAVRDGDRRDWIYLGFWSLTAAYLHYYGVIAMLQVYLFLGLWLAATKRKAFKPFAVTAACVLLAYLP
jgi:mannosyltransferase